MRSAVRGLVLACFAMLLAPPEAAGYQNTPSSLKNRTNREASPVGCAGCHAAGSITTAIGGGASQLVPGGSANFTVTASGATQGHKMGVAIATSAADASPAPLSGGAPLTYFSDTRELIHGSAGGSGLATVNAGGQASYGFTFNMPAGATPGQTYTLHAVARVGNLQAADSGWAHASAVSVVTAPVAPGSLTASSSTSTSVSLSWSGSGPGYRIVHKTGSSAPASPTDGTATDVGNVTSTTISGLSSGTQYSFRVYSRSTSGATVYTAGGSATRFTAPNITSSLATLNGTVGVALTSYQIVASGATSFGASGLPPGVSINGTGLISGTPTAGGNYNATLTATNSGGSDSESKAFSIGAGAQTVTFGAAPAPTFVSGGSFSVSATASSGLPVTYSTASTTVCVIANPDTGSVLMVAAGTCTVRADQAGSLSYLPAFATQNVTVAGTVPSAPTVGVPTSGNGTITIPFGASSNNGGFPITGYTASCTPSGSVTGTVSPLVVTGLANNVLHTCSVRANNSAGQSAPSASVSATPRPDPDGLLDPAFGTNGISSFAFVGTNVNAFGMGVGSTGGIAVVGATTAGSQDFAVARWGVTGAADTKFGEVTTDFGGQDVAYGVAWYANGNIIVVGARNVGGDLTIAMARYTSVGALDPTFGIGGKATLKLDKGTSDAAFSVALDRSERIHIAGASTEPGGVPRFFVARITETGALDPAFAVGGVRYVPGLAGGAQAIRLAFDAARRIVAVGAGIAGYGVPMVARLTSGGALDTTFNGTGYVTNDFGNDAAAYGLAFTAQDGPIIAGPAFAADRDFMWTAFSPTGTPGPYYTGDVAGNRLDQARGVIRQADGKVVVAGLHSFGGSAFDFAVMRFLPDGTPDTSFGANGRTVTNIANTDQVAFSGIAHQLAGTAVVAGASDGRFVVTRYLLDAPSAFAFASPAGPVGTTTNVVSDAVTIANISVPVYVQVSGGFYSIGCNGTFTTARGEISAGQTICVRHLTANNPGETVTTTLVVGGQSATFSSTTTFDATPDAFSFTDVVNAVPGSVQTSSPITVSGINGPSPVSVLGGSYSVGCTGAFTTTAGTIDNGQAVCVQHTAASGFSAQASTTLTIGGVFDTFTSTTAAADTTPDTFAFVDQPGVAVSSTVTSNAVTIGGINSPAAISVAGGTYSVGCTGSFTSAAGTITSGQSVCVRHTAAAGVGVTTDTVLTVGGVSDTFSSTTAASDTTPSAFSFNDVTGVAPGTMVVSNAITVGGIDAPAAIAVSGGTYSIGCTGAFTAAASTITNGQAVCVRHTAPMALSAVTNTTLTIGGVSDVFSSTTVASLAPGGDADNDGIPNGVEGPEARNPLAKDNDIFAVARLFAMQQYRDFLGREGDAGGITFYTDLITSGAAERANVIESFFNSPEFSGSVSPIARLYFATFLRIPDYDGLLFQVDAYRAGAPLAVIANNFTLSPEFTARYGSKTDAEYVQLLYTNVLGRTASQPEIDFHVNRLVSGATRGEVMVGFSESPEYQQTSFNEVYITMMYVGMLRRAPEQSGFDFWLTYMDGGNPGLALIAGFLNAPEYRNRFLP